MSKVPVKSIRCQVAIIGSGMPGSILALVLSQLNYNVVVIDKASHPRFAIGESSTPIADAYLARISEQFNVPELMPLSTFAKTQIAYPNLTVGRKRGFSYFWHENNRAFECKSNHENELVAAASLNDDLADSHWLRSSVDHQISKWLADYDVKLLEKCEIQSIRRQTSQWKFELNHGSEPVELVSDYFFDASGGTAVGIRSQGGRSKVAEMRTNTSAVFAHFEGLKRWSELIANEHSNDHPFVCDDAAVHHLIQDGWMWQLRFESGLTSCGIVEHNPRSEKGQDRSETKKTDPLNYFLSIVSKYPSLQNQFELAYAVTPRDGAIYRKRLQHWFDLGSGPGWCALPHSLGFVDPLHSKGLAHVFSGIYRIGHIFAAAPNGLDARTDRAMSELTQTFDNEIRFLDRLISLCYQSMDHFELFRMATLWYFAAATNFEFACSQNQNFNRPFLLSDDQNFTQAMLEYGDVLENAPDNIAVKISQIQSAGSRLLQPFDRVGLFHPAVPNMYSGTSAPENTKTI